MNCKLLKLCLAIMCCFSLAFASTTTAQCTFDIKDYPPADGKDCAYLLVLSDSGLNGWDGASLDVTIAEGQSTNYKVTVADGECLFIPIYVNDGEIIDLAYWNGAFETEHGLTLYNALGEIATDEDGVAVDFTGNITANSNIRVKADCPLNSCKDETENFSVRITMGNFPEEQSWEIYDGTDDVTVQGTQVIGTNANIYNGLAPGFQVSYPVTLDLCNVYTFVAFDGFNDGWDSGIFEIFTSNLDYGTEVTDPTDSFFGQSLVLSGTGILDETRLEFTLPCAGECADVLVNTAVNCEVVDPTLPVPAPEVCYPECNHALGCAIEVQQFVLPFGNGSNAIAGTAFPYTGSGSTVFAGTFPAGQHSLVTQYTYCDGIIAKCTSNLVITGASNPTLTCNDNVIISLNVPTSELGSTTLGECVTMVTPDMVLENTGVCEGEYVVTIQDQNGNPVIVTGANGLPLDNAGNEILPGSTATPATNFIGPDLLSQTLKYTVTHLGTNNSCWGTITVEDKIAPVIECNDYELNCTHPEALNEDYSNTEVYTAEELPANIAGGNGGIPSNTFIPVNVGCNAFGEVLQAASLEVIIDHNDLTDLTITLHAPTATGLAPTVLAGNTMVADTNIFDLTLLIGGTACADLSSSNPQLITLETSGAAVPASVGMTWYVQVTDNNNGFFNDPTVGGGEVTAANLSLTCGFPTPGVAYDCSLDTVVLINESVVETDCNQGDWNGAQIVRTWQAIDLFGNSSVCTQTVSLKAPTLNQIVKPANVTIECTGQSAEELTLAQTGTPTFGCFDLTQEVHGLCDISYTYEDNVINTCGDAYKVIRSWTIISWCSGVTNVVEQIIKVEDTTGPAVNQDNITIGTNPYTCDASVSLNDLNITDDCSGVGSISASYNVDGNLVVVNLTNGGTLTGLPLGENQVEISASDACLNTTIETITITVEDTTIPVAVCDDELHISLGGDGTARLDASDIDEGSYDNCSDIILEVRRTDGCLGTTEWNTYVPFECCDIDELVTVELRVTDMAGNSNVCWKSVLVEDALAPIIICPEDKTLNCNDAALHDPFTAGSAIDNCNATISFVDAGELDQCKAGTLTRTFTATDGSSKSVDAVCTQTITVVHVSDFVVQFPADVVLDNCELTDTGAPTVTNDDCELIAISSEDQIFDIVADACYKIERTWTVINWCAYDQGADNTDLGFPQPLPRTFRDDDGYFKYVQTIKVLDEVAPIIDCKADEVFCDITDGCEGEARLTITATDACSDVAALEYTYKIDAFNDGSFDLFGTGNDATGIYPYGTHAIKWVVEDGCGNASTCEYLFTIEDCKNPTPVCLNGISIPNMETSGCVDVWASDLLEYAFDNCTADSTVEASARIRRVGDTAAPQSAITLCCDDLGTVNVELWVEDEAGNADFCTTYIILQDNNNTCDQSFAKATLGGNVHTKDGDDVENVMVEVSSTNMADEIPTDAAGNYVFTELDRTDTYTVQATKDVDPLNGVSTYDLVLISQHILGVNTFENPYTMIAADVNNDGNVTTFDVVQLRQLILYVITDFPSNTSWRFVDAGYTFPNPINPWTETFPETVAFDLATEDVLDADLMAIKIGDVNGDATPNSLVELEDRTKEETLLFAIDEQTFETDETVKVDFRASDFDAINGYQFTFNFNTEVLTFDGVEAGALNVSESNFGLNFVNEGTLTTSWHGIDSNIKDNAVLFTLTFNAAQAGTVSEVISINSRYTNAEAYTGNDLMDVALVFNTEAGTVADNGTFELYQNTPNPFSDNTLIGFNLPAATRATLVVYDVQGRVLKFVSNDFAKGYNQISLDKGELNATGILYYELSTPTDTDTKKMIILE